jgi:hypothetical protein
MELKRTFENLVEFIKKNYFLIREFRTCVVHIVDDNKLGVKFEAIVL